MSELSVLGKMLIFFGIIMIIVGGFFLFGNKIPFFGKLPGDIAVHRKNLHFYFPITTSIIISIILSLILWLLGKR